MLPKDILIHLALEYDLPTIFAFCQTSKRGNEILCLNDNFWYNKIQKDFGLTRTEVFQHLQEEEQQLRIQTPRSYYEEIYKEINGYSSVDSFFSAAISSGRLDFVKIALFKGADINYVREGVPYLPLVRALIFKQNEIFDYLLEKGALNIYSTNILKEILTYSESIYGREKIRIVTALFDKILPKLYSQKKYKVLWPTAIIVLEREREFVPDLYDRRINELKALV
jgi:hypothetical protein